MNHGMPPNAFESMPDHLLSEHLKLAVANLPARYRRRLAGLCDSLDHWLHLRTQAMRAADELIADLRLENTYLRFDLEATRRELENLGSDSSP